MARLLAASLVGHADILFCHDAPAGWTIPNLPSARGLPHVWEVELPASRDHQRQLARIMDKVEPALVVHGHYHSGYRLDLDADWGSMGVVGLNGDGSVENLALLDCLGGAGASDA